MGEIKRLKDKAAAFARLERAYDDAVTMTQMAIEDGGEELYPEARELADRFMADFEDTRIRKLLSGEHDRSNAIITLHSGAGGTEACDWVSMLMRMYLKWAEKRGFKTEIMDFLEGEEAGVKSVAFSLTGEYAYGYMRGEKGVHRLVRMSPFDGSGRRHTSFASCDVLPEMDDSIKIEISPDEIKMDVYRSSGAGGQKVNKTSSAVRLTHIPTGIVVSCQTERSQYQNRDYAMKMLTAKLYALKEREMSEKVAGVRGVVTDIGWSNQIRSYVFQPYSLVKDLRTGHETGNVQAVMDGELDPFMNEYLLWKLGGGQ
jgi:peptide chain release factor 2